MAGCFGGPLPVGRLQGEVAAQVVMNNALLAPQIAAAEGSNANKRKADDWFGGAGGRVKAPKFTSPLVAPKDVTPGGCATPTPGLVLKSDLNMHCSKISRISMGKNDIVFTTTQVQGGFQSTLTMPCMPDIWALQEWVGEVSLTRSEAENSVSGIALKAIKSDPNLMAKYAAPPKVRNWKGKGQGKGDKGSSSSLAQRSAIPAGGHYVMDASAQALAQQQAHQAQLLALYGQAHTAQPGVVGFGGGYGYGIAPRGFH